MSDCERLREALNLVKAAMSSPNTFENSKESTFSALRRGCLDLRKSPDSLDSHTFSTDMIEDAWLFLMELSKAKLRRKHALECINIMLTSAKWIGVLRSSSRIKDKMGSISRDMQIALGHKVDNQSPQSSSLPNPTPIIPTKSKRNPTPPLAPPVSRQKSKARKAQMTNTMENSPAFSPTSPKNADSNKASPANTDSLLVKEPALNESNPFKLDFNPFKEFRGTKIRSNPYARSRNANWWEDQPTVDSVSSKWW